MGIDFRACLNALSDVIINRPKPLRLFDQIYMKLPDMLLHTELISRWFAGKSVVFVGDGDAIALSLVHLSTQKLLPNSPRHVLVLDFDERVVNSVNHFATSNGLTQQIEARLYNVADPLPAENWQKHDAFHTNPPWGASNKGSSVCAFIERGIECVFGAAIGCLVIGDHPGYPWTHRVQKVTERLVLDRGFRVAEVLPEFHSYHLDDAPELTSCAMMIQHDGVLNTPYSSEPLDRENLQNFYGADAPMRFHYVRDLTNDGKLASRDVELEPFQERAAP